MLACDHRIATTEAKLILAFIKVGLVPDSGGTYFLPRLVGTARAMGLALFAEKLSAEDAEKMGLIWKAVDDEVLMKEAQDMAARLAAGPTATAHRGVAPPADPTQRRPRGIPSPSRHPHSRYCARR